MFLSWRGVVHVSVLFICLSCVWGNRHLHKNEEGLNKGSTSARTREPAWRKREQRRRTHRRKEHSASAGARSISFHPVSHKYSTSCSSYCHDNLWPITAFLRRIQLLLKNKQCLVTVHETIKPNVCDRHCLRVYSSVLRSPLHYLIKSIFHLWGKTKRKRIVYVDV